MNLMMFFLSLTSEEKQNCLKFNWLVDKYLQYDINFFYSSKKKDLHTIYIVVLLCNNPKKQQEK
jgi:hypothetical protein